MTQRVNCDLDILPNIIRSALHYSVSCAMFFEPTSTFGPASSQLREANEYRCLSACMAYDEGPKVLGLETEGM
jgi:phage I-like protein